MTETTSDTQVPSETPATDTAAAPAAEAPKKKPRAPWPQRRALDLESFSTRTLAKQIAMVACTDAEEWAEHGINRDDILASLEASAELFKELVDAYGRLPENFPQRGKKVASASKASAAFETGAKVVVKEKARENYVDAFDPAETLTVHGPLRKKYVPICDSKGRVFFVQKGHLTVVEPASESESSAAA